MSLPNFICIGPIKSGTTTMYDILRQHPEIYISTFKKLIFLIFQKIIRMELIGMKNYFKNADKKIIAEFTPSYFLRKDENIDFIKTKRIFNDLGPKVKFIVLLRHPVDRALLSLSTF